MSKPNVMWYEDKRLSIIFDHKPNVHTIEPVPSMTQAEKDLAELYPFINCTALKVTLFDHIKQKKYQFTITKHFRWNGADIPRLFWFIIGSRTNPKFRIPSLLHDFCCNNKGIINFDRQFSTDVFKACLKVAGVKTWRRELMCHCVDIYQRLQKGWNNVK